MPGKSRLEQLLALALMLVLTVPIWPQSSERPLDKNLRNLKWTGYLRTRIWHLQGGSFTSASDASKTTDDPDFARTFQDMFFRNRFTLVVHPLVEIKTVFDIGTLKFGEGDNTSGNTQSDLGDVDARLKAKNVYFRFRPTKNADVLVGLQPFAFPGGHILAKDGAGFKYQHRLWRGKIQPYLAWVKALEKSNEDLDGNSIKDNNQGDHDIYAVGSKFAIGTDFNSEAYYVHSEDLSIDSSSHPYIVNWGGVHNKLLWDDWVFKLGGIYNWGLVKLSSGEEVDISAALWEAAIGYTISDLSISIISEGATGDPTDQYDENSFQGLKPSHGFSSILVDNSGGLAVRSGGRLYGIRGGGLKLEYVLLGSVSLELKYIHFQSMRALASPDDFAAHHFADEFNFKAKYVLYQQISFFLSSAALLPQTAYTSFVGHDSKDALIEGMFGAQVKY